jgi:regulator of protease activity HflC (stomatin/prohibitin superfamily)
MAILNRKLEADEAAVIVQGSGKPPLLVSGPAFVRTFGRWRQMNFVDLRPLTLEVSAANVSTKDHVSVNVRVDVDARVVDPVEAATKVVDYAQATRQIAETAVRGLFRERLSGGLDEQRTEVEAELLAQVAPAVEAWGVSVSVLRIQLVE